MIPVPTAPTAPDPIEWDLEKGTVKITGAAAAAVETPAPLAAPAHGERKRKRKKRSKPYNPRRHLEEDDYVSGLPTPPRSLSPPGPPSRPPLRNSDSVERGADRGRVRVRGGREERLSRLNPAESCSGSFFRSRQIRHSTLARKSATIAGRWAAPACSVHVLQHLLPQLWAAWRKPHRLSAVLGGPSGLS